MIITQALLLVSGCAAVRGYPARVTDPASDLSQLQDHINAERIAACLGQTTLEARTRCRNEIIGARLYATDIQFSRFEEGLFQETRTAGFSATLASLGLTSAAAGAGGVAAQVLSGAAAFIIGGREAYQKEVLAERTLVAIHTAMRAGRARVGLRLREGLRQDIDQYPLEVGLADLNAYYDAGTVLGALVGITEAVGTEARQAERELQLLATPITREFLAADARQRRNAMWDRIAEIEGSEAQRLVRSPPAAIDPTVISVTDPANQRETNEGVARRVLNAWVGAMPLNDYEAWETALGLR